MPNHSTSFLYNFFVIKTALRFPNEVPVFIPTSTPRFPATTNISSRVPVLYYVYISHTYNSISGILFTTASMELAANPKSK